jgi:hypothetical protein
MQGVLHMVAHASHWIRSELTLPKRVSRIVVDRFDSPGRKAGNRLRNNVIRRSIPGLPAWAIKDFLSFVRNRIQDAMRDIGVLKHAPNSELIINIRALVELKENRP